MVTLIYLQQCNMAYEKKNVMHPRPSLYNNNCQWIFVQRWSNHSSFTHIQYIIFYDQCNLFKIQSSPILLFFTF